MWRILAICVSLAPAALAGADYDKLAHELVAPCCWQEALALHRSPAADQARAELRGLIEEGKTEDEIRAWFVANYGERILLTPEGGKAQALFWGPILVVIAGLLAGGFALRRWTIRRAARPAPAVGPAATIDLDDSDLDW
jgi:cytochrome c-type biogenesis protein CcmH